MSAESYGFADASAQKIFSKPFAGVPVKPIGVDALVPSLSPEEFILQQFDGLRHIPINRESLTNLHSLTGRHEGAHVILGLETGAHIKRVQVNKNGTGVTEFGGPITNEMFHVIAAGPQTFDYAGGASDRWQIQQTDGDLASAEQSAITILKSYPVEVQKRFGSLLAYEGNVTGARAQLLLDRAWAEYVVLDLGNLPHGWTMYEESVNRRTGDNYGDVLSTDPDELSVIVQDFIDPDNSYQQYTVATHIVDGRELEKKRVCHICGMHDGAHFNLAHDEYVKKMSMTAESQSQGEGELDLANEAELGSSLPPEAVVFNYRLTLPWGTD